MKRILLMMFACSLWGQTIANLDNFKITSGIKPTDPTLEEKSEYKDLMFAAVAAGMRVVEAQRNKLQAELDIQAAQRALDQANADLLEKRDAFRKKYDAKEKDWALDDKLNWTPPKITANLGGK